MSAINDIAAERKRQVETEGWSYHHDDKHDEGQLSRAAACYAAHASAYQCVSHYVGFRWPWARKWWKPKDQRGDLVRAGALIVAEIERLDRAVQPPAAFDLSKRTTCRACDGAGRVAFMACKACGGTGALQPQASPPQKGGEPR